MKVKIRFILLAIALVIAAPASSFAERVVLQGVNYINQVQDTHDPSAVYPNYFQGHNSCGPTSAMMLTSFNKLQPDVPTGEYSGYWIPNPYNTGVTDKKGRNYSNVDYDPDSDNDGMDMDGNFQHLHSYYGAHGQIVNQDGSDWKTFGGKLEEYIENHGLIYDNDDGTTAYDYAIIKKNIDAGLPLIGHGTITYHKRFVAEYPNSDTNGKPTIIPNNHFLVIIGYDSGENDDETNVIVHDPYGNACNNWYSTLNGGASTEYPLYGYADNNNYWHVNIDYVIQAAPVGVYNTYPGFRNDKTTGGTTGYPLDETSQLFVDCYDEDCYDTQGGTVEGKDVFGIPANNHPDFPEDTTKGTANVHEWPDDGIDYEQLIQTDDILQVQDLKKDDGTWTMLVLNHKLPTPAVLPVTEPIVNYWHVNFGYMSFGPPTGIAVSGTDSDSNSIMVQPFKWQGVTRYIGYPTNQSTALAYEYTESGGVYTVHNPSKTNGSQYKETVNIGNGRILGCWLHPSNSSIVLEARNISDGQVLGRKYLYGENLNIKNITTYPMSGGKIGIYVTAENRATGNIVPLKTDMVLNP